MNPIAKVSWLLLWAWHLVLDLLDRIRRVLVLTFSYCKTKRILVNNILATSDALRHSDFMDID